MTEVHLSIIVKKPSKALDKRNSKRLINKIAIVEIAQLLSKTVTFETRGISSFKVYSRNAQRVYALARIVCFRSQSYSIPENTSHILLKELMLLQMKIEKLIYHIKLLITFPSVVFVEMSQFQYQHRLSSPLKV